MKKLLPWLTALFALTFVFAPAVTEPFMGYRPEHFPNFMAQPPIQPAGYAFAIWGVIYSWLIVSAGFGLWKRRTDGAWQNVRGPLALSLALGTLWLAIANATAIWATLVILIMAAVTILALLRTPSKDYWWLKVPLALYAGWLTAASFVSLSITVAGFGLLDYQTAGVIGLLVAMGIAVLVQFMPPVSPAYGAAVMWALTGIVVQNGTQNLTMTILASAGIAALAIVNVTRRDFA